MSFKFNEQLCKKRCAMYFTLAIIHIVQDNRGNIN